jgi:hypothetical protein
VRDNVGQIIPNPSLPQVASSSITSLRLPPGLYALCYSNNARVSYFEQVPQLAAQPYILSRRMLPPRLAMFGAVDDEAAGRCLVVWFVGWSGRQEERAGLDARLGLFPQRPTR